MTASPDAEPTAPRPAGQPGDDRAGRAYRSVSTQVDLPALERDVLAFWADAKVFERAVDRIAALPGELADLLEAAGVDQAADALADRQATLRMVLVDRGGAAEPPAEVHDAVARWESFIAAELGDPVRAEVVRLVGDGLFGEALVTGTPPAPERVDRLIAHLQATTAGGGS